MSGYIRKIQDAPVQDNITKKQAREAIEKVMSKNEGDIVQVRNPKTDRYIKIDRASGKIIGYKKTKGPYKNVTIK